MSAGAPQLEAKRFCLRRDLTLHPWDADNDGKPRVLVRDPVSGSLELIAWPETLLLEGLQSGAGIIELTMRVAAASTLRPTPEEVGQYLVWLGRKGWLAGNEFLPREYAETSVQPHGLGVWISRILFARINLVRPDRFFTATLPLVRRLGSLPFCVVIICVAAFGLYLCLPRLDEFLHEAAQLAEWRRAVWLVGVIACVRLVHEFAHGYTVKAGGAAVGSMGIILFLLIPLPFVDVTDAWRLPRRRRFRVAAAGMASEIAVAAFALPLWALAPPGPVRQAALALATVALVSTLTTNLNPGARFDGYFMLSHLLNVENLRARGSQRLRWWWRKTFWGIADPDPEAGMGRKRRTFVTLYTVYAFIYRLFLFAGITFVIYRALPKVFGIVLAGGWLATCLVRPALFELSGLWKERKRMNWRAWIPLAILAALFAWLGLVLPRRAEFPAVARVRETAVIVPISGELVETTIREGDSVGAGTLLARVRRTEMDVERQYAEWSAEEARRAEELALLSPVDRSQLAERQARTVWKREASRAWMTREEMSDIVAGEAGTIGVWYPWVKPGTFFRRGNSLGMVLHPGQTTAIGLVDMSLARKLDAGSIVSFIPDDGGAALSGTVVRIEQDRLDRLEDGILAQAVSARYANGEWRLPQPMLRVVAELDEASPRNGQTGTLRLRTRPYSLLHEAWLWVIGLIMRESGV